MKGILSTHESDFMSEFFSSYPFPSFEQNIDPSFFEGIDNEQSLIYNSDIFNASLCSWPKENSGDSNSFFMNLCLLLDEPNASSSALYILDNEAKKCAYPGNQILQCKRKLQTSESCNSLFDINSSNLSDIPKKKSRVSNRVCAINGQTTKNQDTFDRKEEKSVAGLNGLSSCNYSSEDDSNSLQELNGGGEAVSSSKRSTAALNLNSKTRASRGSATDPQSLYARKRRERINERLRILQNMVPNGTKVDISTMLEEAVQYVKFLQLQIKLLSSDDLWMYAPIAYNAMNIGLDLNNSKPA